MKCVVQLIIILCVILCVTAKINNLTLARTTGKSISHSVAMRCKEHVCRHGYVYDTFYEVFSNGSFEMHMAILAASNGHILLSSTPHPGPDEPVYEFVIGGGANKFSELRRNLRRNAKVSAPTIGILSAVEFRAFYIKITEDGTVELGREGETLPILSYVDYQPLNIRFFSFAAWNGVEAIFLYDCPKEDGKSGAPDSIEVQKNLSPSEELKRTLLMDKLPNLPPGREVEINLGVRVTSIKYDAYDSKITPGLAMAVAWTDNSLSWFPDKFNGTKVLQFSQGQIWSPSFFVFNSNSLEVLNSKNPELITVTSSGEATYHFHTTVESWCFHNQQELPESQKWPNEEYDCILLIGAWQPHEKFILHSGNGSSRILDMFADIDDIVKNEWDVAVQATIVPITMWNAIFLMEMDNDTHQSDQLLINLTLKRQSPTLNIVFYVPLLVLVTFVLLSFFDEPLQMSRVWFYTGCAVAVCAGLCYVTYLVPCHTVPTILILYTTVLMGVLVALLVQVMLMTPTADKMCKTLAVQSLMTTRWFRVALCLPVMKTCKNYDTINEAYTEDEDAGVLESGRNGTVTEMQTESTKYGEKEELAMALDKLMFFIYSVTFGIMLALHY